MRKITNTRFYSKSIGKLAKGCQLCVQGKKLVLVVTGLCPRRCDFCPLSDQKKDKDLVWANEWQIDRLKDIIKEAELTDAKGAGFTGGDPLLKLSRTIKYIKALKKRFGKAFHIHLYTSLDLVSENNLKLLYKAGLDEIRFHPDLDDTHLWPRIILARKFKWAIGIEIPVIPGKKKQIQTLLDFINNKIDFINLNELEISDANSNHLLDKGFKTKNSLSYAVRGSETMADELLKYCAKNTKLNVHFCTAKLKDKVQLRNRIKRRAKNVATKVDLIDEDGLLVRGVIYIPACPPGEKNPVNRRNILNGLKQAKSLIEHRLKLKKDSVLIDILKFRLLISPELLFKKSKEIRYFDLIPAIVEEYPTQDGLEVEVTIL